jgi:hypothetical protein
MLNSDTGMDREHISVMAAEDIWTGPNKHTCDVSRKGTATFFPSGVRTSRQSPVFPTYAPGVFT